MQPVPDLHCHHQPVRHESLRHDQDTTVLLLRLGHEDLAVSEQARASRFPSFLLDDIMWLFEVSRGLSSVRLLFVAWAEAVTLFSPGSAGAGGADAASLVGGVAEAVGVAGFELGDAVEAFGAGVGHAGQDGGDDLVLPAGDGTGEGGQLGDLLVLGAPVVEGKEPVPDLPLAGD